MRHLLANYLRRVASRLDGWPTYRVDDCRYADGFVTYYVDGYSTSGPPLFTFTTPTSRTDGH